MCILDTTAGWGRVRHYLPIWGRGVHVRTPSSSNYALLRDGLTRLARPEIKLSLLYQDAKEYLKSHNLNNFDCIYIDPMHPIAINQLWLKKTCKFYKN